MFTDKMVYLISQWVGKPIYKDPPVRDDKLSFKQAHQEWEILTNGGKYRLNTEEYADANERADLSLNESIFISPCNKQNCGVIHNPAGHITHFMTTISACIHVKM